MKPNAAAVDDAAAPSEEYTGALVLPDPYKTLMDGRFTITKEAGVRNYSHNATPESLYDWNSATEVFISYNGAQSGLGDSAAAPITMQQFVGNFNGGSYGDEKDFVFTIVDDIYSGTAADAILVGASGALGCEAYDINTTPSDKIGFNITSGLLNTYLIDCYATGTKIRAGYCGNENSYALDLCGNTRFGKGSSGNVFEPMQFSWDNVKNGVWNAIESMTVTGIRVH